MEGESTRPLPTKVVVRLLPPTVTESEFLATIPEESREGIEWTSFVAGKRQERATPEKPNINARCYIHFLNNKMAIDFISKFHGHCFIDEKGESFRAVTAFAPFQRICKYRLNRNKIENTIETKNHYINFINSKNTVSNNSLINNNSYNFENERAPGYQTPLVKALREQRRHHSAAETRRKNVERTVLKIKKSMPSVQKSTAQVEESQEKGKAARTVQIVKRPEDNN